MGQPFIARRFVAIVVALPGEDRPRAARTGQQPCELALAGAGWAIKEPVLFTVICWMRNRCCPCLSRKLELSRAILESSCRYYVQLMSAFVVLSPNRKGPKIWWLADGYCGL